MLCGNPQRWGTAAIVNAPLQQRSRAHMKAVLSSPCRHSLPAQLQPSYAAHRTAVACMTASLHASQTVRSHSVHTLLTTCMAPTPAALHCTSAEQMQSSPPALPAGVSLPCAMTSVLVPSRSSRGTRLLRSPWRHTRKASRRRTGSAASPALHHMHSPQLSTMQRIFSSSLQWCRGKPEKPTAQASSTAALAVSVQRLFFIELDTRHLRATPWAHRGPSSLLCALAFKQRKNSWETTGDRA